MLWSAEKQAHSGKHRITIMVSAFPSTNGDRATTEGIVMNHTNVYEKCPVYQEEVVTLRQTAPEDAEELLRCYSDEKAVPFFNADNCFSDFHYTTLEQVQGVIARWNDAYQRKLWVRWTIIGNNSKEKVGTVEMF